MKEKSLSRVRPTPCDPVDRSPPGSSVHGILQARIPEWAAISFSRGSSQPRDQTCISWGSCFADRFFSTEPPGKPLVNETNHTNPVHDHCTDADTPAGREPACFSVSFPNKHLSKCTLSSVLSPPSPPLSLLHVPGLEQPPPWSSGHQSLLLSLFEMLNCST